MDSKYSFVHKNGVELLVYRPWWDDGLVHGMTTRAMLATKENFAETVSTLCAALGIDDIFLPLQSHSNVAVNACSAGAITMFQASHRASLQREPADAVIAPITQFSSEYRVAYGIVTADCVPILVRSADSFALIHAGWRGLANGVIKNCMELLRGSQEALVFAAAGSSRYEVGAEVIEAIGSTAVFSAIDARPGFYRLDTAQTAINQLRALQPDIQTSSCGICTIEDGRFHSFRRDGELSGRGVTFIVPPLS